MEIKLGSVCLEMNSSPIRLHSPFVHVSHIREGNHALRNEIPKRLDRSALIWRIAIWIEGSSEDAIDSDAKDCASQSRFIMPVGVGVVAGGKPGNPELSSMLPPPPGIVMLLVGGPGGTIAAEAAPDGLRDASMFCAGRLATHAGARLVESAWRFGRRHRRVLSSSSRSLWSTEKQQRPGDHARHRQKRNVWHGGTALPSALLQTNSAPLVLLSFPLTLICLNVPHGDQRIPRAAEAELNKRTEIAKQFVQFYYALFDHTDRSQFSSSGTSM